MFQRFSLLALLLGVLALGSSHAAHAKDSVAQAADRQTIVAAHARIDRARTSKNIDPLAALVADDFRFYSIIRLQQDRETFLRIQVNAWNVSRKIAKKDVPMRYTTKVTQFQWRGPDAIVWTTLRMKTTGPGAQVSGVVNSREYWGKTSKGWQLRQIVELSGSMTMNGETVNM